MVVSARIGDAILDYVPEDVVRTGYILEGWAFDEIGTEPVGAEDLATEADTLYAVWLLEE